ncbi:MULTISPECIES: hypothetical protein [Rheinheimera]|uniref:Uncharacterized protein n=1 Tax=Rheinheimera marina TaxID=1774958 RepID=A0ABV9JMJ1_9GAMM
MRIFLLPLLLCSAVLMAEETGQANAEGNALSYALKVAKPFKPTSISTCPDDTALSVLLDAEKQQLWQHYWQEQAASDRQSALYHWVYGPDWLSRFEHQLFPQQHRLKKAARLGDNYRYQYEFDQSEQANLAFPDVLVFDMEFAGFINPQTPDLRIRLNKDLSRVAGVADLDLALNQRMVNNPCLVTTLNAAMKAEQVELKVAGKAVKQLKLSDELLPSQLCVVEIHQQQQLLGSFMMPATQC